MENTSFISKLFFWKKEAKKTCNIENNNLDWSVDYKSALDKLANEDTSAPIDQIPFYRVRIFILIIILLATVSLVLFALFDINIVSMYVTTFFGLWLAYMIVILVGCIIIIGKSPLENLDKRKDKESNIIVFLAEKRKDSLIEVKSRIQTQISFAEDMIKGINVFPEILVAAGSLITFVIPILGITNVTNTALKIDKDFHREVAETIQQILIHATFIGIPLIYIPIFIGCIGVGLKIGKMLNIAYNARLREKLFYVESALRIKEIRD